MIRATFDKVNGLLSIGADEGGAGFDGASIHLLPKFPSFALYDSGSERLMCMKKPLLAGNQEGEEAA